MPPKLTHGDDKLISLYREAALRIARLLSSVKTPKDAKDAERAVNAILRELEQSTADYLGKDLTGHFKRGSEEAAAALRKLQSGVETSFTQVHQEALNELRKDAALKFANALEGVRRETSKLVTAAEKQRIINKLIKGEREGAGRPAEQVKALLEQRGIVALESATRKWTLENYADMLTRTVLAEAHNTGAMTRYLSNGVGFGQIIEHADTKDATCKFMNGKVVSLADRRLLPPYHPNCMGAVKPFLGTPDAPIMSPEDPRIPAEVKSMLLQRV
jgi:uncharacterized protein YbjQ (UPF0145 family)